MTTTPLEQAIRRRLEQQAADADDRKPERVPDPWIPGRTVSPALANRDPRLRLQVAIDNHRNADPKGDDQ